ncbi:MAG: hypothetical protein IKD76_03310 [Clostridia bacterium]|nr:hypothetical protein [Clostridia bacterium]
MNYNITALSTTDDGSYKIPVLYLGIQHLHSLYPDLFNIRRAGNYRVSEPYIEEGHWYVNVPITEEATALEVAKFCGNPKELPTFIF